MKASYPVITVPPRTSARYELGDMIASGGMGSVYRAFDRLAQRTLAYKRLKLIEGTGRARLIALFQREYDMLKRLTHPSIVEAYDFGFDEYGPYYTMELLSGADLARRAPLPFREGCGVVRDVASALALLHARKLVHRDVSPNNVRLTESGHAKLIDFGALTGFGNPSEVVGTPAFIAPECLGDAALDQRTDLYALGALAYWTLTGHVHVQARSLDALPAAWAEPLCAPSHYVAGLPKALDELVIALLQHDPLARPASAAEVMERLSNLASLEPERDAQRIAYSYLAHTSLVERAPQLDALRARLRDASGGAGQLILLEGEQGLGRTAVLEQLAIEAQLAAATSLRAAGGLDTAPFSTARQLVVAGLSAFPELASKVSARSSLSLRGIAASPLPRSLIDASERHAELATSLQDALLTLSARTPLVLLIDDAHQADVESIALFASMAELIQSHPILLVLSVHPGCAAQDVQVRTKLESCAVRIALEPLSEQALSELVYTTLGGVPNCQGMAAWLYAQTGGNPGHALDLVRALIERSAVRYTVGTFTLPYTFEDTPIRGDHLRAALAKLGGVSEPARQIASLLSVHAGSLGAAQLAAATGVPLREVLLALHTLIARGVVRTTDESFSCAGESLRQALCGALSEQEARAAHLALARTFQAEEESLETRLVIGRHLLSAGGAEQLEGAMLLARTGFERPFELGMSASIRALLESALSVLRKHGLSDDECIWLLVPLGFAGFFGDLAQQRRHFDRTVDALSSICGLGLAARLRRWVGGRAALILGMASAALARTFKRRRVNVHPYVAHMEVMAALIGCASGTAALTYDLTEAARLVARLSPFAAAPKRSGLYFIRQYALASAELLAGSIARSYERYGRILAMFETPVFGIAPTHAEQICCGCLNGQAQGLVSETAPGTLSLADQLEQRSLFFAPHAEAIRMTYYAFRGEVKKAAVHRARSEASAFRSGTCWSAVSILTVRSVLMCVLTRDVVGLVRAVSELEPLAPLSPGFGALYALAQAHLTLLRGHAEQALPRYQRAFAMAGARELPTYAIERSLHVEALSATGDHAGAKQLCLALFDELKTMHHDSPLIYLLPTQKLALAEAGLGNLARATELLDDCIAQDGCHGNPAILGMLHRDRAYVASLSRDESAFEHHFARMVEYFRVTENPCLIQQCAALRVRIAEPLAAASRAGEPANDQLDGTTVIEPAHPQVRPSSARQREG